MKRVLILGAAGRDFHDFNVVFRNNPEFQVVAFTANQIPDIAGRGYEVRTDLIERLTTRKEMVRALALVS